jgi:hypothetical protein
MTRTKLPSVIERDHMAASCASGVGCPLSIQLGLIIAFDAIQYGFVLF